jgi:hypothetical protein
MRVRPIAFFSVLATFMIAWLLTRMYAGQHPAVWTMSCMLGAWAPIAAAAIFQYVRAVADREHSVVVAWLVRACGMHLVLVWMLGASDWLRGPPGHPSGWNSDVGAPLVLVLFAPMFALGFIAVNWLTSVARRLAGNVMRPAGPAESSDGPAPFRGVAMVRAGAPLARPPLLAVIVGAAACVCAARGVVPAWMLECAAVLSLALCTARNHRALRPSVAALVALLALSGPHAGASNLVSRGVAWPWFALLAVAFYLAAVEGILAGRRLAVR